jgi:serine phosphatase RsbU (regulator of sigma subunit)
MLSPKNALGIFLYVNIVSWLLLLGIKLIVFFGFSHQNIFYSNFYLKGLLLNFFLLFIFFYFSASTEKIAKIDFVELLTNLFIVGLIAITLSLAAQFVIAILETPPVNISQANIINILYHFNIVLVVVFLSQAFFYWKQMVLYQKNDRLQKTWNVFEYLLLISLLFNFFEFNIGHFPFAIALAVLLFIGLILSVNLKWVAYLNAKEKWQSVLLLLFITIFSYYFFYTVISHSYNPYFTTDLMHSVYVLAIFVFVIFYSIFSLLVVLFNLPTTSVFEKKAEDVISLQKLAQSLQSGESEKHVYEVLLESAVSSVNADAAWLEVKDEKGIVTDLIYREISPDTIAHIKRILRKNRLNRIVDETFARNNSSKNFADALLKYNFGSILVAPLIANDKSLGSLNLLKKAKDGFDNEKKDLIHTFARQASLSIENFRLLSKTIEAERYKEELKIAQRIQKSLLPKAVNISQNIEIEAFSEPAYEVGGDYYDFYQTEDNKIILVVGDVSGKGTTAAFHMAQMKGIFQTLAQMQIDAEHFLKYANQAIANCLAKTSFITLTLVLIDTENQEVEIARAGHCPTLYYSARAKKAIYFDSGGLGLGIIRKNQDYAQYLETQFFRFAKNDLLLLYTDGIVEAKNEKAEEYGYDRLIELLEKNATQPIAEILEKIKADVNEFMSDKYLQDDCTALIIKAS